MRRRVRKLHSEGLPASEIALRLGVVKSTVAYHLRRLDVPIDPRFARRYDWESILAQSCAGTSFDELISQYGFSRYAFYEAARRRRILLRPATIPIEQLLVIGRRTGREHLKRRLVAEGLKENRCEICGIVDWQGRPLKMQLHHVNGDGTDNRIANLQFLCGNCHSQTSTFAGRNRSRKTAAV